MLRVSGSEQKLSRGQEKGREREREKEREKRLVTMPVRDKAYNVSAPCTANSHR